MGPYRPTLPVRSHPAMSSSASLVKPQKGRGMVGRERMRERERDRDRERDRQTERQRDRQTDRQAGRQTE